MKLNRSALRKIILQEIQNSIDEEIIFSKDGYTTYGMQSKHNQGHAHRSSCRECGSKMYEGDKVCEQCGYSMTEEETRKEYNDLNEGGCGSCGSCSSCDDGSDYSTDTMGMVGDALGMLTQQGYDVDATHHDHKVGNHKVYKGSYMAKSHLYKVNKYSEKLYHMIPDGHNLEDWMRTKLAQIADDIGEVYHALDHDKFEGDV